MGGSSVLASLAIRNLILTGITTGNQLIFYFQVIEKDENDEFVSTSKKILIWVALAIQLLMQAIAIMQQYSFEKQYPTHKLFDESLIPLVGPTNSNNNSNANQNMQAWLPAELEGAAAVALDEMNNALENRMISEFSERNAPSKSLRVLFAFLSLAYAACFGLSNVWVQNAVNRNYCQLLIFTLVTIQLWQEVRVFVGKHDLCIVAVAVALCALISSSEISNLEITFAALASVLALLLMFFSFDLSVVDLEFDLPQVTHTQVKQQKQSLSEKDEQQLGTTSPGAIHSAAAAATLTTGAGIKSQPKQVMLQNSQLQMYPLQTLQIDQKQHMMVTLDFDDQQELIHQTHLRQQRSQSQYQLNSNNNQLLQQQKQQVNSPKQEQVNSQPISPIKKEIKSAISILNSKSIRMPSRTLPMFSEKIFTARLRSQLLVESLQERLLQSQQQLNQMHELHQVTDQKVSRILQQSSQGAAGTTMLHTATGAGGFGIASQALPHLQQSYIAASTMNKNIQSIAENVNTHLRFYQGMIEKLDSAIFVIGGPNKVYEALNSKAEQFFRDYFEATHATQVDFMQIFKKIVIKDYSKGCFGFLESLGLPKKVSQATTAATINSSHPNFIPTASNQHYHEGIQKKDTLSKYHCSISATTKGQLASNRQGTEADSDVDADPDIDALTSHHTDNQGNAAVAAPSVAGNQIESNSNNFLTAHHNNLQNYKLAASILPPNSEVKRSKSELNRKFVKPSPLHVSPRTQVQMQHVQPNNNSSMKSMISSPIRVNSKQNIKMLNLKTQSTTGIDYQHIDEVGASVFDCLRRQSSRHTANITGKTDVNPNGFEELSLLDLIDRILRFKEDAQKQACNEQDVQVEGKEEKQAKKVGNAGAVGELIEVITFETGEELLSETLKFAQIKLHTYTLNNEQFMFLQFSNNREREEMMRQKIHKAIEYQTFKTISHELGTYTNFILTVLDAANNDFSIPEKIKTNYFQTMQNNTLLLNSIIQDIRDYNNYLNNDLRVKITQWQLQPLVVKTCQLFKSIAELKNVKLEVVFSEDVPKKIYADKMKIQQILVHLIHNAFKFSKSNCIVGVSVSFEERTKMISFSVADNGIGMDELEQERLRNLLDNLYLAKKVSPHSSGFGFGLTISNILAKHIMISREIPNREALTEAEIESCTPGIHFSTEKSVGSEFRFFINLHDSDDIIAQSASKGSECRYTIFQQKFEFIEIADDIAIQEKDDQITVVKPKESNYLDVSKSIIPKSRTVIRTLHQKLSKTYENSMNVSKHAIDKSRFFSTVKNIESSTYKDLETHHKFDKVKSPMALFPPLGSHSSNIEFKPHLRLLENSNGTITEETIDQSQQLPILANPTPIMNNRLDVPREKQRKTTVNYQISRPAGKVEEMEESTDETSTAITLPSFNAKKSSSNQPQILIVDDEVMNIFGLKLILKSFGINPLIIQTANDGQEALDLYINSLPSDSSQFGIKLILMDVNMPIMDGLEATVAIKAALARHQASNPPGKRQFNTNIVACTSYDDLETKLECFKAGMVSYLSKPFSREGLLHIIDKYYHSP